MSPSLKFLNNDQARTLQMHLDTHLNHDYAVWLIQEIDDLCDLAKTKRNLSGKLLIYHMLAGYTRGVRPSPVRKKHRPHKKHRAELIRQLSDCYPEKIERKKRGGYFAETVKLVVFFIEGMYLADPVDTIIDALRGCKVLNSRHRVIQKKLILLNIDIKS